MAGVMHPSLLVCLFWALSQPGLLLSVAFSIFVLLWLASSASSLISRREAMCRLHTSLGMCILSHASYLRCVPLWTCLHVKRFAFLLITPHGQTHGASCPHSPWLLCCSTWPLPHILLLHPGPGCSRNPSTVCSILSNA